MTVVVGARRGALDARARERGTAVAAEALGAPGPMYGAGTWAGAAEVPVRKTESVADGGGAGPRLAPRAPRGQECARVTAVAGLNPARSAQEREFAGPERRGAGGVHAWYSHAHGAGGGAAA